MFVLLHQTRDTIPVCRLCGTQLSLEVPYFDVFGDSGRFLAFAIQKYLEIEVSDKENYSKNVCHTCNQRIEEWNDFYTKCHELQTLFKNTPLLLGETNTIQAEVPSASLENENVSNQISKLVEELVQDGSIVTEKIQEVHEATTDSPRINLTDNTDTNQDEVDPLEVEDGHSVTEDEFEEEFTTDNESDDNSDNSTETKPKQKPRHKKFIFTIPFLEKKVNRKFTPTEKAKLQKHISKRQNTLICKQLNKKNSY